ncbi:hypothetical protein ACP70R_001935 [Stipagrostis hirtigluma subsp. patula]
MGRRGGSHEAAAGGGGAAARTRRQRRRQLPRHPRHEGPRPRPPSCTSSSGRTASDDCEPEQRVPDFIKGGADIVNVHCKQSSTIHLHRTVNQVKRLGAKAGVVLNPATPLTTIDYVLDVIQVTETQMLVSVPEKEIILAAELVSELLNC